MGCHSWAVNTLLGPRLTPNWEFNYYTLYKWPLIFDLPIKSMVMFHTFLLFFVCLPEDSSNSSNKLNQKTCSTRVPFLRFPADGTPFYGSPVPVPVISIVNPQRGVSVTASGSERSGEYGSIGSKTPLVFGLFLYILASIIPQLIWLVVFRPSEKWWSSSVGMMIISQYMESHKSHVPNHQPVMLWNEFHVISML